MVIIIMVGNGYKFADGLLMADCVMEYYWLFDRMTNR